MRIVKFLVFIALIVMITVSFEKVPKQDIKNTLKEQEARQKTEQKEIEAKFTAIGTYGLKIGRMPMKMKAKFTENTYSYKIPFNFNNISKVKLIHIYENKEGVKKAILQVSDNKFLALFLRNITENTIDINIDFASTKNYFNTEEKAINAAYPALEANEVKPDIKKYKFGWHTYTKEK